MPALALVARPRPLRAYPQPVEAPGQIGLGTAVRISPCGGWRATDMTEVGVVIEVVPPGQRVCSAHVAYAHTTGSSREQRVLWTTREQRVLWTSRSGVARYVVRTRTRRLVRRAGELVVVAP